MFRPALQTITWGDPQHHLFDHIFARATEAGYLGVEIGFRRLGQVSIDEACDLLTRHGLQLSACHVGGNLADLAQAADERAGLDKVLSYLNALDSRYLIYSGLNVDNDTALDAEIERLRAMAAQCADNGVTLLYHNHDWEFRNARHIWRRLHAARIEPLGFAPDLGWAVKGGHAMADLLGEIGDNIHVLHFKDFITWEDGQNTCHLGEGVVDFAPAWEWLATHHGRDIWVTAEQDNAKDNDRACAANAVWLRDFLARLEV